MSEPEREDKISIWISEGDKRRIVEGIFLKLVDDWGIDMSMDVGGGCTAGQVFREAGLRIVDKTIILMRGERYLFTKSSDIVS